MSRQVYLRDIFVTAHPSTVDIIGGGFVQRFHRETICVTESILKTLWKTLKSERFDVLAFEFYDTRFDSSKLIRSYRLWPFDFMLYDSADASLKKSLVGDALEAAMMQIAQMEGWNLSGIKGAFEIGRQHNFMIADYVKKSFPSPSKQHKAKIFVVLDIDRVEFFLVVFSKRGDRELWRTKLHSTRPVVHCVSDYAMCCRWLSDTEFEMSSRTNASDRHVVSVPDLS